MLGSLKKPYFNAHNLYLFGAFSICIGLSLSKPLLALGQLLMFLGWLKDGHCKRKIFNFFSNPLAVTLVAFFALSVIGLVNTSDFGYAIKDIKRKLPLFVLPFLLFYKQFSRQELKLIFTVYVVGVIASSFWSVFVKLGGLGIQITDYRDLSRFNSHIRFGLEICLAIFGSFFYFTSAKNRTEKITWIATIIWLALFMLLISLFTGIVVLLISTSLLFVFYYRKITNNLFKPIFLLVLLTSIAFGVFKFKTAYTSFYTSNSPLPDKIYTVNGDLYFHDSTATSKENGYYTWKNNCFREMYWEWGKKSKLPFHENDLKGQKLKVTLTRFLTSKGQYKDSLSVYNLTPEEVIAIENGIANYKLMNMSSIDKRLFDLFWELDNAKNNGDYNGHSILMRLEFWQTGIDIFLNHLFFGVGTGDIQTAFDKQYEENNSMLKPEFRLRAHQQFITIGATFGLLGLVIFCWFLFYPVIKTNGYKIFLYLSFFIIVLLSMLTEDTLDTQIGITFFAFFNTLFLTNLPSLNQD